MNMNVLVIAHAGVSVWWAFVGYAYGIIAHHDVLKNYIHAQRAELTCPSPLGSTYVYSFNALFDGYDEVT
jgi:hypothetical protein